MSHINKLFGGVKVQRALFLFFLEAKQWHRTGRHAARRVSAPLAPEISVRTRSQPQSRPASSLDTEPSRRSVLAAKFPGTSSRIWSGLAQVRLFFFGGVLTGHVAARRRPRRSSPGRRRPPRRSNG